ncbi:alpha/beta hydrolase [Hoyosella sp. YIM 151337]|uniref:alpha/beta fold hydrolase n=1 Tax=Hoyosella sp. YIM 151337 TaxID=2992742 RepID=UPI002235CBC2|nr:alpha/beta hydrolase [Hoyosella sp. YIM 151337]MCW4354530.1 alpha/beta hydrolase [Hoyosella sp. YIM 151337]
MAYVEGAGKRRVLVLHGWALDSAVWSMTRSVTDLTDFTYAYVDFPGYGANSAMPPAQSINEMAQFGVAAADELGWDVFCVLGHSMGGATALRMGAMIPDRVESVVALTPVAAEGTPLPEKTYDAFDAGFADPEPLLGPLAPNLSRRQLANIVARCHQSAGQQTWSAYLRNWTAADVARGLEDYEGPTHLFIGEHDGLVTAEYLGVTDRHLVNSSIGVISGAGHYPMLEQPEQSVSAWEHAFNRS